MKIAQIAPLYERVPPRYYGGTERVVSYLTEQLVQQGHEVTLFASGDSLTSAELVPCCDTALRLNPAVREAIPYHLIMLDKVRRQAHEFDILHFHIELLHYPLLRAFRERTVTTLHERLDRPDLQPFYRAFPDFPLVAISNAQRRPMPPVNWMDTVYHGLPRDLLPFQGDRQGDYLVFLGRVSVEKGLDHAIEIATRTGLPLKIAAKIDDSQQSYWDDVIAPQVAAHPNVQFIGEIAEESKAEFIGRARALLFPIEWPEPFGLVMIEAMACGTPTIAFRSGSTPEVVDDGVTGFVVSSVDEAVEAVARIGELDRAAIRRVFEERFTIERMTSDYLAVYRRLLDRLLNAIDPPTTVRKPDGRLDA